MKKNTFIAVLANRNFLRLWLTQTLSLTTAYMLNFVLMDHIFRVTNSSVAVSFFLGFYALPTILLGPFVGVLIDIVDKKGILFLSNFLQAFIVLFYIPIRTQIWPIYSLVLLYSFCDEFLNPCVGAVLPSVVKEKDLPTANSLFFLTIQGALILGFILGGIILRFLKFWFVFPFASFLLLLAAFLGKGVLKKEIKKEVKTSFVDLWEQLREGYNFIKNEPRVYLPIIFLGGLQLILGIAIVLLPSISKTILKISFADSPFVLIIPGLLGAALGSLIIERKAKIYRKNVFIIYGLSSLTGGIITLSLIPPFFHYTFILGSFLAIILGLSFILLYVPLQTLIQEHTPFNIRGRVFTLLTTVVGLAGAFPLLATATLVDFLGVRVILFLIGAGLGILAIYIKRGRYGIVPANYRS